jgi:hypothetical protein
MNVDLGTVLSLLGTAFHTSYVTGSEIDAGRPRRLRFSVKAVTISGTNCTDLRLQVLASDDGVTYRAVTSQDDADEIIAPLKEHVYTDLSTFGTYSYSLVVDGGYKYVKLEAMFTGGVGKAGESIVGTCLALS